MYQIILNGLCQGWDIRLSRVGGGGKGKGKVKVKGKFKGKGSSASVSMKNTTATTNMTVPFVSIKTARVFCNAFCDFGPNFEVAGEDGEVPRETPLDGVKVEMTGRDRDGEG